MDGTAVNRWEHFEHQADIGVRGFGETLSQAFEQVALAMLAVMVDPGRVRPEAVVEVACTAPDPELLLADWLNALLCEMSARRMLFSRFEVEIQGLVLRGRAWGETVDPGRHQPAVEVKGASYFGLKVERRAERLWAAECVVDV